MTVERDVKCRIVSGLTVAQAGVLLGIAVQKLNLKPCPVDVKEVNGLHSRIRTKEDLARLRLLALVQEVRNDNLDLTLEADGLYDGGMKDHIFELFGGEPCFVQNLQ